MIESRRDHAELLAWFEELVRLTQDYHYATVARWADEIRPGLDHESARKQFERLAVGTSRAPSELKRYGVPHRLSTVGVEDPRATDHPTAAKATALVMLCSARALEDYVPRFKPCVVCDEMLPARAPHEGRPRDPARCAFHRDRRNPDGLRNTCVGCDASRSRLSRRGQTTHSGLAPKKRQASPAEGRSGQVRSTAPSRAASLERSRAMQARERPEQRACATWLRRQIARGRIRRPPPCACGGRWRPVYADRTPGRRALSGWKCERCGGSECL